MKIYNVSVCAQTKRANAFKVIFLTLSRSWLLQHLTPLGQGRDLCLHCSMLTMTVLYIYSRLLKICWQLFPCALPAESVFLLQTRAKDVDLSRCQTKPTENKMKSAVGKLRDDYLRRHTYEKPHWRKVNMQLITPGGLPSARPVSLLPQSLQSGITAPPFTVTLLPCASDQIWSELIKLNIGHIWSFTIICASLLRQSSFDSNLNIKDFISNHYMTVSWMINKALQSLLAP